MTSCPTGCGRDHRAGHLMCPTCWAKVPGHLQRDVVSTWRAYNNVRGHALDTDYHARKRAARLAYTQARDAAIGAIG